MPNRNEQPPARSIYRGIRVGITQRDLDGPCLVTLSTKQLDQPWDEWDLLFPAIRVPIPDEGVGGYQDILKVAVSAVQALIRADQQYM